ncbi:recombinase family protein [Alloyangia pacifica]|uniref:recombinase family protein n=1 Tax=Alloyangia pacifica TaxID=311180 RepID=UPI001CFE9991|nr:recombinase family protein [Alloyangia pacifica]
MLNLERAFEMAGGSGELPFLHDYCRNVRGLGSLPALQKHLQAGGSVLLDDIGRLFRACESSGLRKALHRELLPYASSIRGVRQNMKVLSDLSQAHTELLFSGQLDPKFVLVSSKRKRSSVDLAEQTFAATEASALARHDAALKVARQLGEVRDRMVASGEKATLARIAEQANADGLRTTRGSLWRADTVSRALKRLKEAVEQAEASQNDA